MVFLKELTIKVYGKWIWAGEYTVLKSYPALVFPLPSQFIELSYQKSSVPLKVEDVFPTYNNKTSFSDEEKISTPLDKVSPKDFSKVSPKASSKDVSKVSSKDVSKASSKVSSMGSSYELKNPYQVNNSLGGAEKIFCSVLDSALKKVSKTRADLKNGIHVKSCIAFGAGIGSSAVLSVVIGRLFCFLNWIKETELFHFCHSLENEVHGQSSGVDISAVLINKALVFSLIKPFTEKPSTEKPSAEKPSTENTLSTEKPATKNTSAEHPLSSTIHNTPTTVHNTPTTTHNTPTTTHNTPTAPTSSATKLIPASFASTKCFSPKWKPLVFLSYSARGASTKENIQQVKQFWKQNPNTAQKLDQQMAQAVLKAQKGLEDPKKGFPLLVESLALAEDCFSKWNLIGPDMQNLISFLKKQGACGVKPVGSGSGGYVLSLWSSPPPSFLKPLLISAF